MSIGNCNSLSCGHRGPWRPGHANWGCGCGNTCGCVASDGTPACNPWAPWGTAANATGCSCGNTCGCVAGSSCSSCNGWVANNGCSTCGSCGCGTACSACGIDGCGGSAAGTTVGCLLPRIISTGRTFQRRITQTLCVDDLPDCAESPLTLVGVTVSGQATWEQISECRQTLLRVDVPVAVQIRDCSGRCRTGHSTVTLTIPLCMNCPAQDFWRGQLFVAPCIRLAAPVTENEDGCFDAPLEVQAEVFLLRMQVVNC